MRWFTVRTHQHYLSLVAVFGLAFVFVTASHALVADDDAPKLRSNLPAADRPTIELDSAERRAISNSLLNSDVATVGITESSLSAVRLVNRTDFGPLYLVPGLRGACLVIPQKARACGDPGAPGSELLALAFSAGSQQAFEGGGVTTDDVKRVMVWSPTGERVSVRTSAGVFLVTGFPRGRVAYALRFAPELRATDKKSLGMGGTK